MLGKGFEPSIFLISIPLERSNEIMLLSREEEEEFSTSFDSSNDPDARFLPEDTRHNGAPLSRANNLESCLYIYICVYVGYILAYWKRRITRVNPVDGFIISTVRDFRDLLQIRIYNSGVVLTRKVGKRDIHF